MKAHMTALILIAMSTSAYAEDWRDVCESIGEFATAIMESRQSGVSMSKMMKVTASQEINDLNDLGEELIISAYDSPRYSMERMQKRSVEEFRDEVYLKCVKSMRPKK